MSAHMCLCTSTSTVTACPEDSDHHVCACARLRIHAGTDLVGDGMMVEGRGGAADEVGTGNIERSRELRWQQRDIAAANGGL